MIRAIYTETREWIAFPTSKIPLTLELIQSPRGYGVHIYKDKVNNVQNLSYSQAIALYGDLSERLWGVRVDPYEVEA